MSIAAYKQTIKQSESPRQIERRVLSRVTSGLERHAADYDSSDSRLERSSLLAEGLRDHLVDNQSVWMTLKYDLSQPDNALPPDLRAMLISIALWVERHTTAILGGEGGVRALVEVNRNIVNGLAGQGPRPLEKV